MKKAKRNAKEIATLIGEKVYQERGKYFLVSALIERYLRRSTRPMISIENIKGRQDACRGNPTTSDIKSSITSLSRPSPLIFTINCPRSGYRKVELIVLPTSYMYTRKATKVCRQGTTSESSNTVVAQCFIFEGILMPGTDTEKLVIGYYNSHAYFKEGFLFNKAYLK